jgi:hypothetical protein
MFHHVAMQENGMGMQVMLFGFVYFNAKAYIEDFPAST